MKNELIIKILHNIAEILELQGVEWKPQAYQKVARMIEGLTEDLEDIYQKEGLKGLKELPGVGEHIALKIEEIIKTGKSKYYNQLKKEVKVNLEELSAIPNLGPKKIQVLYKTLGIKNIKDLEAAIKKQKLRKLSGFGEETEKKLLEGIMFVKTKPKRFLYAQALPIVNAIKIGLSKLSFVKKVDVAGSFIRGLETVGDLDFLVVSTQPEKVMEVFSSMKGIDDLKVKEIIAKGLTKSSIRLENGIQIDLRVVKEKEFGSAINYFTGSKAHNIELRKLALKKGFTLSEYGLFKIKSKIDEKLTTNNQNNNQNNNNNNNNKNKLWVAGRTEEEIYKKLGLQFIAPELRENTGEIEVALQNKLPQLITNKDINGLFHNHSVWSDGNNSLLEMAQKAEMMGMKFITLTDHYSTIKLANPLNEKRFSPYLKEIEKVRKKVGIRVFSGAEIDIDKNGDLTIPKKRLKELDVVIGSVHTSMNMPEEECTKRVVKCLNNWNLNILGHPTGRLINERPALKLNLDVVFKTAKENNTFLEINTQPNRLDLNGMQIKAAKKVGCKFVISPDAHTVVGLETYPMGVLQARRGWLEKKDVLNCWSLKKIEKVFGEKD
ncbi:MAG: DNA polymerase/3'-5' exonuclease PolX [Candidatus Woesearchaeota archaeon]